MISSVSGPHVLPLELNFAHLFLLFSVSPENLDPVDFGAGGRGEAFKSAAPGLSGERSVWDEGQKSVRFEVEDFQGPRPSRQPSRTFGIGASKTPSWSVPGPPESPRDAP